MRAAEVGHVEDDVLVVEVGESERDGRLPLAHVHHEAGAPVDRPADGHLQLVVVPVTRRVVALPCHVKYTSY